MYQYLQVKGGARGRGERDQQVKDESTPSPFATDKECIGFLIRKNRTQFT
jgi:hypothetical protein